ncbi:YceI family protein [Muricauda sp. 334s03]|uniref:YceI family protein n=1 Tax=Flagellimonas yonaguniensis TaxID=3031325 RepID=A0ABT5Y2K8_9FLAO|nr:YceI family protein [[Muricauda] yonaguniensis]MDF0717686.1 YceI family protein [[Muricauda] yonaguniensis]
MKTLKLTLLLVLFVGIAQGQEKFITKQGHISFFSHSPVEDIEADNNQVLSIVDISNGEIAVSLLIQSFIFEKSLMQEHFNENYMESHKYPKAIFRGKIQELGDLTEDNKTVNIEGELTIRGISKPIETTAEIKKMDDGIALKGSFLVEVKDYKIKIPSIVANNIAKTIKVSFELIHQPYN